MEDLTKHQLFLAALLTSFVTSIATGIVTVSLMDQAPPTLTQTVNQVVEHTVERIVPATTQTAAVVTTKQVIVNEDDLVTAAIEKNLKSLVTIATAAAGGSPSQFAGLGVVVSADGTVVGDSANYQPGLSYTGTFGDGTVLPLTAVYTEAQSRIVVFKAVTDSASHYAFTPATLGDSDTLKLGQTVAALSGSDQPVATVGSVSSFITHDDPSGSSASSTVKVRHTIIATAAGSDTTTGGPLFDTLGSVVGIRVGAPDMGYVPVNLVKKLLADNLDGGMASSSQRTASTSPLSVPSAMNVQ